MHVCMQRKVAAASDALLSALWGAVWGAVWGRGRSPAIWPDTSRSAQLS